MKTVFELGASGRGMSILPPCGVPEVQLGVPARETPLRLPQLSETEVSRHYTELCDHVYGVNNGIYPLGSCTMKYNPKINEQIAALPEFTEIHPLQPEHTVQGCLEVIRTTEKYLAEITGMDAFTMQPAAGAHGEFTGLLLIKSYHLHRNEPERTKIIVPDSAHSTNPASAVMAGFEVINIPSGEDGCVDLDALRAAVGPDTAGLMLTNPNTAGLFDRNILEITKIIHEAGGLCYYDGANLNGIMGIARPGDMGFDCMHLNLHKSFSTPHGGGGPGSGPVGCKAFLAEYLPGHRAAEKEGGYTLVKPEESCGDVRMFEGNFLVVVKALTYLLTIGGEGVPEVTKNAVLNANYMMEKLSDTYTMAFSKGVMHEFIMTLEKEAHDAHVTAMDIAKTLLDYGIHPPTMYFPLIVHEALMCEPTETESRESLDRTVEIFKEIYRKAQEDPAFVQGSPRTTYISRPDEVKAAREPVVRFEFD